MIQNLRERLSGVVAIALIILIAIPLAFFGIESIFMTQRVVNLGEVNGEEISQLDFDRAVAMRNNRIMTSLGENYSPEMLDSDFVREAALNDVVVAKLYLSQTKQQDMSVSDVQLSRSLVSTPAFQLNDEFSESMFRNYLVSMGYSYAEFMDDFREDLTLQQLTTGVLSSGFSTDMQVEGIVAVSQEERSYKYIQLPVESVLDQVNVTEEQIQAFYDQNSEMFEQPEMISVNYVRLTRDQFLDQIDVNEDEVMERFEILQSQQPDQFEVAHILVEDNDQSAEKLDQIQSRLDAGEAFETVAEELSEDIGSANNGGYLGYTDGNTFPTAFEEAIAELEVEQVSSPVQTDAGFHIIKLLSIEETPLDFDTEYAAIELQVKQEAAEALYVDALENFREASFSTSDLEELLQVMNENSVELEIESSEPFEQDFGTGIAANAQVRAVSFGPIVREENLNSEVVELTENNAVVVHLNDYFPAGIAPLEQVREEIASNLRIEQANDLLADRAEALAAELDSDGSFEEVAQREQLEWQAASDQTRQTASPEGQQIFAQEITGLPSVGTIELPQGGFLVYKLSSVEAGSLDDFSPAEQRMLRQQLGGQAVSAEFNAYTATLRANADIDLKVDYSN